ncbi:membrane protein [Mycoplasma feriruminatoris]|uniref:Membrane protein n=1 Tax=Mycoplasma feriruminatoris TaxID=1179777 RepID=A0AAQ3DQZ3_9MOLU|nr:aromatic motif membrane protein [Mycoplasma feriruminatoris]UKS54518.1 hypothetical protein D500_00876 [Mycoplasma feriruminatoris]WFQ91377.1 membrane protein [Mycoplasma feriruminatoris]WFQ95557.1 membrane protein [Mycoplasma feriruminatoris]WFQ96374.1 membrane protein [Mycoplasma feriruminatoris]VZK65693.1 hypothetical protein MF5292_00871 [Mycoplasma feriruminatoris]
MNKNKKTLINISIGFAILPFLILPSLFFINKKPNTLNLVRPLGFDVYDNLNNDKSAKTKKLLLALIDDVFKNSKLEQQEFLKKQEQENKELSSKAKELSSEYLKNPNTENLKKLKDFYSKNWLFVFQNLSKFEMKFISFWKLEANNKKELHSKEFLEEINKREKPKDSYHFLDNNIDLIKVGKENEDLPNLTVYYLRKDRFIIRALLTNDGKKMSIDKFILFNESIVSRINIDTISDAIHLGVFHNQQDAFTSTFEKHIIKEYGYPWDGILLWKEK